MRYIIILLILSLSLFNLSCTKECFDWYSDVELRGVSKKVNSTKSIKEWFETERMSKELSFWIVYISSADGYEGCKSRTRINNPIKTDTRLYCSNQIIIGKDTIPKNTNLYKYFEYISFGEGNDVLTYNISKFNFPIFENPISKFGIEVPLTDGKTLKASKLIELY